MTSILITGIGGTRSIAVLKTLRQTKREFKIVGTDANYFNAGSTQCDKAYIVPLASDDAYLDRLETIIKKEKIQLIFATVEKEVRYLAAKKKYLEDKYQLTVAVPNSTILETCFDKYQTQQFLDSNGFQHIPTIYANSRAKIQDFAEQEGLPLIRKPVFGYGSKGLSIIKEPADLAAIKPDKEYVLQKFVSNDDTEQFYNLELNEYTAEIFINRDSSIAGGIILKRALRNGETIAGYRVDDEQALEYLSKVAEATEIIGPVNFQYRIQDGKIFIFEINPLLSGTTAVRAELGFNSPEHTVRNFIDGEKVSVDRTSLGRKYFIRYLEEVFVDPADLERLKNDKYIEA